MELSEFEKMVNGGGFRPIGKRKTPLGSILLAERKFSYHRLALPEFTGAHWQILWGIERDGAEIAQRLFFDVMVPRETRILATMKTALDFMADRAYAVSDQGQMDARG
jgi:hypothetical protein